MNNFNNNNKTNIYGFDTYGDADYDFKDDNIPSDNQPEQDAITNQIKANHRAWFARFGVVLIFCLLGFHGLNYINNNTNLTAGTNAQASTGANITTIGSNVKKDINQECDKYTNKFMNEAGLNSSNNFLPKNNLNN